MRLQGKIAVITGAGSGIGRATAILFAQEGARVVCVDVNEEGGKQTIGLIKSRQQDHLFIKADVSNSEEVQRMARKCQESFEKVDILFNNAGHVIWQSFEETTEETWSRMIGTNLTAVFLCSKYLLPLMKKAGAGSIINNASVDAILGNPHFTAYNAAKGGVIPLTHVMAHDLARYAIRVNCLCTGGISTPMRDHGSGALAEIQVNVVNLTPLKRFGTAEEVANTALFFASGESSFVTGATLVVDGGRTAITQGTFVSEKG